MNTTTTWTSRDIPGQSGRIAIVTGASTGIGRIAARELAGKGALVVLAVRDTGKGSRAADSIRESYPDALLDVIKLDLADLCSIRGFVGEYRRRHYRLDLLINNAGVMIPPYTQTADGFELQFGVNHFGHFALTGMLLDMLLDTAASRVVLVSSSAHKIGRIDFDDIHWRRRRYRKWQAYADSKIANLYFTFALQRRFSELNTSAIALAAHPGVAITELQRHSHIIKHSSRLVSHDVEAAALPILRAATDPGVSGGDYFGPDGFLELRGHPKRVHPIQRARDEHAAERLWIISANETGVRFDVS